MTKHLSDHTETHTVCGLAYEDMPTPDDAAAKSIEECDCLACLHLIMRNDTGFFKEYVNRTFEREWRPRLVRLVREVPGMRGDETFTEVLDKVIERLVPATPVSPVASVATEVPAGTKTLLGNIPVYSYAGLPDGTVALLISREPGRMVKVCFVDGCEEFLPAWVTCRLVDQIVECRHPSDYPEYP